MCLVFSFLDVQPEGQPAKHIDGKEVVSPMRLKGKEGEEHWIGLHNFYVITRYNHSKLYAMAVFQLSENLRKSYSVH